jgi:hypothetical protein
VSVLCCSGCGVRTAGMGCEGSFGRCTFGLLLYVYVGPVTLFVGLQISAAGCFGAATAVFCYDVGYQTSR